MNLGTLRSLCAKMVGDPDQSRFSASNYNEALNRAQEQFGLDSGALWKDQSYTTSINDATYALPSDFMFEESVHYDGARLSAASRETMDLEIGSDWTTDTGPSTRYIIDPEEAKKELLLYPIPQEAKTVVMRYYPLAAEMTADTDIPLNSSDLMAQFHLAIAAYAGWLLMLYESLTAEVIMKRSELLKMYNDGITKAGDTFKNTASESYQMRGSRAIR